MTVRSVRPASGADRDLQLDVADSKLAAGQVVFTLHIRDRRGERRRLEIVLSTYEARLLGHALLDRANPSRSAREDD
ncbi:MAG: hypothetical protein JOZ95_00615 [Solirubrobacterales bacterium]|nr:hypothetical protein [Solirubrobacterales bacterium]